MGFGHGEEIFLDSFLNRFIIDVDLCRVCGCCCHCCCCFEGRTSLLLDKFVIIPDDCIPWFKNNSLHALMSLLPLLQGFTIFWSYVVGFEEPPLTTIQV